jgi:signal transduction histidine kinase
MILWTFSTAMFFMDLPQRLALFWINTTYVTASLIPSTFLLFSFIFPSGMFLISKKKQFLIFFPCILFFFFYFFGGDFMINGIGYSDGQKVIVFGPGQIFWNFHFILVFLYAFVRFYHMYKTTSGLIKDRIKYVFFGSLIAFVLATTTNGILPFWFNQFDAIWLGPPLTLTWIVLMAYAIFENVLTEVPSLLKHSVTYTLVGVVLIISYFFIFLIFRFILSELPLHKQTMVSLLAFFVFVYFSFTPIKQRIQTTIDKIFFSESYFSIVKENRLLRKEIAKTEKYKTLATVFNRIIIEIKNPLTALKGYSQYLERNLHDEEFLLGFSKVLNEEVDRITNLIDRLAAHSQPTEISTKLINITKLIDNTVNMLESNLAQQHIDVIKHYEEHKGVKLNIDPDQITQALLNILSNAIDSMTNGGKISIRTDWDDKTFVISIQDCGCGIPPESLPLIFNPFYTLKTGYAGLGLSTAKEIIERHEGTITVESKLYQGTEFIIQLPHILV